MFEKEAEDSFKCMEAHSRENVWKWLGEEILDSDIARFVSFIDCDKE